MSAVGVTVEPITYEVTAYPFHDVNRSDWVIRVERRAEDRWAVLYRSSCWNRRTKKWDYEPMPSSRTDAYKRTHRFDLDTALTIAREQAPKLTQMGWTVERAIAEAEQWQAELASERESR